MSRDQILEILRSHREELSRDFGVTEIALFGSAARGDNTLNSDIDVLVDLGETISLFQLAALQLRLQDLLGGSRIDLVLRDAIFPPLRDAILREAVRVV